jgi:cysteine-rich repeat protein
VLGIVACTFHPSNRQPPDGDGVRCGDGVLDSGEACDDGNTADGDGCDHACAIEPAYSCTMPGQRCDHVDGLGWTTGSALPTPQCSTGGTPFMRDCPAGESIVGFDGYFTDDVIHLGQTRAHCARATFGSDGRLLWSNDDTTMPQGNDMHAPQVTALCNDDELVVGFVPSCKTGMITSAVTVLCRPVAFTNGALALGTVRMLEPIGPGGDPAQPAEQCPDGTFAAGWIGASGAAIDRMSVRCDTASLELAP